MNILIPMAGNGSRFEKAGFSEPKPLIKVGNKPMIQRVVECLPSADKYIFVVRKYKNRSDNNAVQNLIWKQLDRKAEFIEVDHLTDGAACTCLLAKKYINTGDELLIADCDAFYNKQVYWFLDNYIRKDHRVDACGIVYNTNTERNSYVKVDEDGWAIETAEKKVISKLSFTGMHWWRYGMSFVKSCEDMIQANDRTNNEFYLSPAYNYFIRQGGRMKPLHIPYDWIEQVGIPEDLVNYLNRHVAV